MIQEHQGQRCRRNLDCLLRGPVRHSVSGHRLKDDIIMTREMCNDFMTHDVFVNVDQDLNGLVSVTSERYIKKMDEAMSPLEVRLLKYT